MDLIEQDMEKVLEDLREHIQDLREGVLGSQVQPMSHEEFMPFQDKVMNMFASVESRVEALVVHMDAQDQEVRQELTIYKTVVSARVMATHGHIRSVARGMPRNWTISCGTWSATLRLLY